MAANDDNPPPLPGESFEEYKKTIKMDFHKPQYTNPFPCVLPPYKVENIIHILEKCTLVPHTGSDDEIEEGEVEFPYNDRTTVLDMDEIWELVEQAKRQKVIIQPNTVKKTLPRSSSPVAESPPVAYSCSQAAESHLVAYSCSPSPDVESPNPASDISRKKSRRSHRSSQPRRYRSKSPDDRCRRRKSHDSHSESPADSYHRQKDEKGHRGHKSRYSRSKSPANSYHRKKDEKHCRRLKSRDSRCTSPDDASHRKKEKRHKRRKSLDYRSKSPDVTSHRKKEERGKRHRSHDSRSKSPENVHYPKKGEERRRRRRSHNSGSKSPGDTYYHSREKETTQKRLTKDTSPKGFSLKSPIEAVDEDDYSTLLAQEMKKRKLIPDSDEEGTVDKMEMDTEAEVTSTPERILAAPTANPIEDPGTVDEETEETSDAQFTQDMKIKREPEDKKFIIPFNYFCDLCQKALNSQVTWESHMSGKKHAQKVKLQTVGEIAKGSLGIPKTPSVVSDAIPRFANAPLGKKRLPSSAVPRLQQTIDELRDVPLPGLDTVQEIISPMDVDYYCGLCDAPCKTTSIMPHLVGFKHQIRAVRKIWPLFYDSNKDRQDKRFKSEIKSMLMDHEKRYGRGCITVLNEVEDPHTRPAYDQPIPSYSNPYPAVKAEKREGDPDGVAEKDQWLDMSKGDFFCTLCDSHMNNVNMWEAHVRGKRHLGNAKKIPGASISKMKSERIPNAISVLEKKVDEECPNEMVVGLDYIRETRGLNGEIYNCFLCGSCSTNFDILDHILLLKHRTRYLEKLFTDGKTNAIKDIDNLALKDSNYREALINDECARMLEQYGRGRVEVYQTKN